MKKRIRASLSHPAFRFVLTIGIANLFADLTYEGGGSVNGQYLGILGASAFAISLTAGLGEFFGYAFRSLSGYLSDRTGRPWLITFIGYAINLLAVPAMAFAHTWQVAAALIFAERIGRAIRKPTTEAMLSYTTTTYGAGWVYALNTALDETGATLGPVCLTLILLNGGSYPMGYALLLISSILALISLLVGRVQFPVPAKLEVKGNLAKNLTSQSFTRTYWLSMLAGGVFAAGLFSYELIGLHLVRTHVVREQMIPLLLAWATGSGIIANLILGKLYDRHGTRIIYLGVFLSSLFAPLLMGGSLASVLWALPLVGVSYAVQDTLLKALVAKNLPSERRGFAFGLFYSGYGVGWLIGSLVIGSLYEKTPFAAAMFSVCMQLLSIPLFWIASKKPRATKARRA